MTGQKDHAALLARWPLRDVLEKLAGAAEHLLHDHDCDSHGWEGVHYAAQAARLHIAALASPEAGKSAVDAEQELRREWWLNHGHPIAALYGDDGEMQCAKCMPFCDYKRMPLSDLQAAVEQARAQRLADAVVPEPSESSKRLLQLAHWEAYRQHKESSDEDGVGVCDGHADYFYRCSHEDCRLIQNAEIR